MIVSKYGDFTGLAENYSKFRPGYSVDVLNKILKSVNKPIAEIDFADVGAGTGIWTRMVAGENVANVIAIEPNDDMRQNGINDSEKTNIIWKKGGGEKTTLSSNSVDLVTMASSFHWVDFDKGTKEFDRILRDGGIFAALWNPRKIEENPLLVEIEEKLYEMAPHIERKSSGRSEFTSTLEQRLNESQFFSDVEYIESVDVVKQTVDHYLGIWWSVNDIRVQAGEAIFKDWMTWVESKIKTLEYVETTYLTRAWIAHKA